MGIATVASVETQHLPDGSYFRPDVLLGQIAAIFDEQRGEASQPAIDSLGAVALKTVADCNFRCNGEGYECYMYKWDTWQTLPERMPDDVLRMVGVRIGEYTKAQDRDSMAVILHGGEPLYMKDAAGYYNSAFDLLEAGAHSVNEAVMLSYGMQTNASLLTEPTLRMLKERNVRVSCSVDGNEAAHNRNRKTKVRQLGTFVQVDRGIRRLAAEPYRSQLGSLLAVVDLANDPIAEVYEPLCSYGAESIDLLLPYADHDNPPPRPEGGSATPYADHLLTIFHRWTADKKAGKPVPAIRLFDSIINLSRGAMSGTEAVGMLTSRLAFVRTDGSFEGLDALNMISPEAAKTNLNVEENTLEEVARYLRTSRQLGRKVLSQTCTGCKLVDICGGGHIENRYAHENGFDNPSVYCEDLKVLIKEIVAVSNANFREEIAAMEMSRVRRLYGRGIPLDMYPLYKPFVTPSEKALATRIRSAEPEDVMELIELHGAAYLHNYKDLALDTLLTEYVERDLLPRKFEYWKEAIDRQSSQPYRLLVAELGSKIVGFAAVEVAEGKVKLGAHFVSPQVDGYGVDGDLLQEAERTFHRPAAMVLQAIDQSPQTEFFSKAGFKPMQLAVSPPRIPNIGLSWTPMIRLANSDGARAIRALEEKDIAWR